jgi:hypothetical protein
MQLIYFLILFVTASAANAITIDFEEPGLPAVFENQSFVSKGFVFDSELGAFGVQASGGTTNAGNMVLLVSPAETISISAESGSVFSLSSLELASLEKVVSFTGYLSGGGTVQVDLLAGANLEAFSFDDSWSNLQSLEFSTSDLQGTGLGIKLDSINVSTVPIPAAVWLFGSALAGLGWFRRKTA